MRGGRRIGWAVGAIALGALLAGCTPPAVDPSPTPTGFASEEEAFAAAEATYRAYVDALNEVDLADPATFEPVYALLEGDALASSKKELTGLHADSLTKTGPTLLVAITSADFDPDSGELIADVCLDVSQVDVRTEDDTSVVPEERVDFPALRVQFEPTEEEPLAMLVVASEMTSSEPCQ